MLYIPPASHSSTTDASLVTERVKCFKLLGINISHDFNWQTLIDVITSKAATRLHFLRILKKSGFNPQHLLHSYLSVIRPLLEYCSLVWHHGLSKTQCESLEAIQCRALRIIFSVTVGMPYTLALGHAQIPSLPFCREEAKPQNTGTLCLSFGVSIHNLALLIKERTYSCLHNVWYGPNFVKLVQTAKILHTCRPA